MPSSRRSLGPAKARHTKRKSGTLYHHYEEDGSGTIVAADVITPTAQNLTNIEEDIEVLVPKIVGQPRERIVSVLESLVRAYDPCISCSVHFLDVKFVE